MSSPRNPGAALDQPTRVQLARRLMESFAVATGLQGEAPPRRYLWTDAFAVCNFLGLYRQTGEGRFLELALRLIDQVHHVLGRFRPGDPRTGWISGLGEAEGERQPTRGGLRIGKPLPERGPNEAFDPQLEWDRDGQYFHYLTQWMHALQRAADETGQPVFHRWAIELAKAAHAAFVTADDLGGSRRLVWKMSVDLKRVLVPSSGQHDALDAWLTDLELANAQREGEASDPVRLDLELEETASMCRRGGWATDDALGAGGLLLIAYRLAQLVQRGVGQSEMLERILAASVTSVELVARSGALARPAQFRLAFRELGLSIGLHAIESLRPPILDLDEFAGGPFLKSLIPHLPRAAAIDRFWSDPTNREGESWRDHEDINSVMLATSLAPEGYLGAD